MSATERVRVTSTRDVPDDGTCRRSAVGGRRSAVGGRLARPPGVAAAGPVTLTREPNAPLATTDRRSPLNATSPTPSTLRIVGWNCNGGLRGRKAEHLAALAPDVAIVSECARDAEVPGLVLVGWTGTYPTKGLGVFARPELGASLDMSWDKTREWFLPVRLDALGIDVLAVWAMNQRGGEGQPKWRTRRALDHYAAFLGQGRAVVIGDFNDNVRWDRPSYPAFAGTLEELGAKGYVSLYHARTGERHGAETGATIYWRRKLEAPYLIDHAFLPEAWLGAVARFDIGAPDGWLGESDHMPLVLDLRLPLAPATIQPAIRAGIPEPPRSAGRYSERFLRALDVAARMHAGQLRKGTEIPYISHLLGTCAIALEHGATEDEAIAALLHDAIEDVEPAEQVRAAVATFGAEVARIVEACSDAEAGNKGDWRPRKEAYIARIATEDAPVLLVSASDKLHNARAIVADLRVHGVGYLERFNGGSEGTLWYYRSLVTAFRSNAAHPRSLVADLDVEVCEIEGLALTDGANRPGPDARLEPDAASDRAAAL